MLKNKCLYAIISNRFFSITICNLLIEMPSYFTIEKKFQISSRSATHFKTRTGKHGFYLPSVYLCLRFLGPRFKSILRSIGFNEPESWEDTELRPKALNAP